MRRTTLLALLAGGVAAFGWNAPLQAVFLADISIECPCRVESDGETLRVTVGIRNDRDEDSGALKLEVHARKKRYKGKNFVSAAIELEPIAPSGDSVDLLTYEVTPEETRDGRWHLSLQIHEETSPGNWQMPDRAFMELPVTLTGAFSVQDVDYLKDSDGDGVGDLNEELMGTNPENAASTPDRNIEVDVLALYDENWSDLVDEKVAGEQTADTRIAHMFALTNAYLGDSKVDFRFRLSGTVEAEATERGKPIDTELRLRELNRLGSDLAVEFRDSEGQGGLCGVAYTLSSYTRGELPPTDLEILRSWYQAWVFDLCTARVLAHELGHLMGLSHSQWQAQRGSWLWSRGHAEEADFHTIMSYSRSGSRWRNVFSSPDLQCEGFKGTKPCGVEGGRRRAADAVTHLNTIAFQYAQVRERVDAPIVDTDGDGVEDSEDAFPNDPNEWLDTDGDGVGDNADTDDDGDGRDDANDAFPLDPGEWVDTDGDGVGNNADPDDDGDGREDADDAFPLDPDEWVDTDGDGVGNNADTDDDGDGREDGDDAFPLDPAEWSDFDGDGIGDNADTDDDGDGRADGSDAFPFDPNEWSDFDGDGVGDNADTDDDGDGRDDANDAFPLDPAEWSDFDSDGIGDNADIDDDGDGREDANDAFPLDPDEWVDTDGDGTGDNADTDDDGDGRDDANDAFPLDPEEWADTDGDGVGDNTDTDDDGDGRDDANDAFPLDPEEWLDTDGDGVGDNADADDDGDGRNDGEDAFPLDPAEWADTDGDGVGDNADADDDGDGRDDGDDAFPLDPAEWADTDGDGVGDNADGDDDGDGRDDGEDAFPLDPEEWLDTDGDGVGDNADTDDDGDGRTDGSDAFPLDPNEWLDTDGDGVGDNADTDDDGDGWADDDDAFPLDPSEWQDTDGDGIGDNADSDDDGDGIDDDVDADDDGDGVTNGNDAFPLDPNEWRDTDGDGTGDNADPDDDGDGRDDGEDAFPLDPAEWADTDGDGIGDNADADDDGDGQGDGSDAFPLDPAEWRDTDGDGIGDNADPDDDGDGRDDGSDAFPLDPTEWVDTDGDGIGDNADGDDDGDGRADGSDAFPLDPTEWVDTDGDGVGDNADADDDGDGWADDDDAFPLDPTEWRDSDGDGIGDNADGDNKVDDDGDGVANEDDAFPSDPNEWADSDGDGVGDNADADDDGDGRDDSDDMFPLDPEEWQDTDRDGVGNNADGDDDGDGRADRSDAFPLDPNEWVDTDRDGIGNNADPDDDGDGQEDEEDAFPLNPAEWADTDGDGIGDNADADDDGDGVDDDVNADDDGDGVANGDDAFPLDPSEWADTDGDGVGDNADAFPLNALESADSDGDGVGDNADAFPLDASETVDTDGDGVGDNADTDDDGDGTPDAMDLAPLDASRSDLLSYEFAGEGVGDGMYPGTWQGAGGEHAHVLLGAPSYDDAGEGGLDNGSAYLVSREDFERLDLADGLRDRVIDLSNIAHGESSWRLLGAPGSNAGQALASRGDMDGDGVADVLVGAPGMENEAGAAYFVSGADLAAADEADGARDRTVRLDLAVGLGGSFRLDGAGSGHYAGVQVAMLADRDGDGRPELLLGAQGMPAQDYGSWMAGAFYLVAGGDLEAADAADGDADGRIALGNVAAQPNSYRFVREVDGDLAGSALAPVGDADGDGVADILMGAGELQAEQNGEQQGGAYLISGGRLAELDTADGAADGTIALARAAGNGAYRFAARAGSTDPGLGRFVEAAGDMNGDGVADLMLGTGAEHAFLLSGAGLSAMDAGDGLEDGRIDVSVAGRFRPSMALGFGGGGTLRFGASADTVLELRGAFPAPGGACSAGGAYLYAMPALTEAEVNTGGMVSREAVESAGAAYVMRGGAPYDFLGASGHAWTDLDGDGASDILLGAARKARFDGREEWRPPSVYLLMAVDFAVLDAVDGAADRRLHFANFAGDTDGDGVMNALDADDDGDGVEDAEDAFPLDAGEWSDADGDCWGNNADTDDDGDGVADAQDAFPLDPSESVDTDGDGIGNNADADDDGDGVEDRLDVFPLDPARSALRSFRFKAEAADSRLGQSLAVIGDIDGDGLPEVALGAPSAQTGGAVYVLSAPELGLADNADGVEDGGVAASGIAARPGYWKLRGSRGPGGGCCGVCGR